MANSFEVRFLPELSDYLNYKVLLKGRVEVQLAAIAEKRTLTIEGGGFRPGARNSQFGIS